MDRKEFLSPIGVSAAAFTIMNGLACSKGSNPGPLSTVSGPMGVDFTVDLTAGANSALLTNAATLPGIILLWPKQLPGLILLCNNRVHTKITRWCTK